MQGLLLLAPLLQPRLCPQPLKLWVRQRQDHLLTLQVMR
jgi:hypothetical protein